MRVEELRRRAEAHGIASRFRLADGRWRQVAPQTLAAVLEAMAVDADAPPVPALPPVVVARRGRQAAQAPPPGSLLVLESGEERAPPAWLPGDLPLGWHRLVGPGWETSLVVAPGACHLPGWLASGGRARGWAAQLYGLRSRQSWGIGDLGDLATLAAGPDRPGFVLLNPLHAAPPGDDSPYYPSSRLFRSPLYLRVDAVPETAALEGAERERLAALAAVARGLTRERLLDRVAVWRCKDQALRACWRALPRRPERLAAFQAWRAATHDLEAFASFCALQEHYPGDWRAWPAGLRHPTSAELARWRAAHPHEVGYHAYLQWLLDEQLAAASSRAAGTGRLGLVNDLAVGFDPTGFDAWWAQDQLAPGVTVGAPPDALGPSGQDWAVPAFVPSRLAASGYAPFARTLRAGMAHAGGLRLDHVMGLFRLYWIPHGAAPTEGTYVRYPVDDLLGVLALESRRAGVLVIGEDLGTVEPRVRERLQAERVLSYRLVWFEREPDGQRRRAARYPRLALAAVTTHDLPTAAGWQSGDDLRRLGETGVVAGVQLATETERQAREREELCRLLETEGVLAPGERSVGEVVVALYAFLARTPAMLVAATLEDAVLARERPNVPGTTAERPNWRIPLPVLLEDLWELPSVRRLLEVLVPHE
ncbi:MAG TPA: 4-alpha-glucanotransferase [Actinomycetes bacterium]|jgi:4-alpha-glucanotransferase|nr:4-alpha-glucanotransferase [Actinomycetes bacterium]